ncbi:MAG TPA: helix-turn-helix domain-containing protein [Ilumatobacteraceae bacterium]|nr:helix-turn-helix domain-containing protein [Ilumatobacteraceae bacterium]
MSRRDEIIEEAVAILREEGPAALTSVNVAARIGVTQSAVYRHIVDMDELSGIASRIVVSDLTASLNSTLLAPGVNVDDLDGILELSTKIVKVMEVEHQAFEVIDRWRFAEGTLGTGIRELLAAGRDLVVFFLESEWRSTYGYVDPLRLSVATAQQRHGELILEDVITAARFVRQLHEHSDIARMLQLRIVTSWTAYVVDMQSRLDRPLPHIDVA